MEQVYEPVARFNIEDSLVVLPSGLISYDVPEEYAEEKFGAVQLSESGEVTPVEHPMKEVKAKKGKGAMVPYKTTLIARNAAMPQQTLRQFNFGIKPPKAASGRSKGRSNPFGY